MKAISHFVYDALSNNVEMHKNGWQQVLLGCTSALIYLRSKDILHNDIKCDNILIETTESGSVRAILVDFNKACLSGEGRFYTLSPPEKKTCKESPTNTSRIEGRI